jgi:hypothetical protein
MAGSARAFPHGASRGYIFRWVSNTNAERWLAVRAPAIQKTWWITAFWIGSTGAVAMLGWDLDSRTCHAQSAIPSIRIVPIEGDMVDGKLLQADARSVQFELAGVPTTWESEKILKIEVAARGSGSAPPLELGLLDGSTLRGTKLVGKEQAWQFGDSSGGMQELGPGVVRSLLVRSLTPELAKAWNEALKESSDSDALILLRPGNVVDRVSGVISEVKDGKVVFDLDGQAVEVAFEKILGMIWFRKPPDRLKPKIEIELTDGSSILTETLSIAKDTLTFRSLSGRDISIPLARVSILNYANANVQWLADVPVLKSMSDRRMDWKSESGPLEKILSPRFVSSRGQAGGSAPMNSEDLDLVFLAPGSITFRVPEGFTRLRAKVQRSGNGNQRSDLSIEVQQDDQIVFEHAFKNTDDAFDLDIPVVGGKKITLTTSSKTRLQVGSQLTWKQPRLTR